jgi:hypothetical protein
MSKTVIIHEIDGSNDITNDTGWDNICVAVALDHDTMEVVGSDVAANVLRERMEADGYRVLHEDDEFVFDHRWVRKPTPDEERTTDVENVVALITGGRLRVARRCLLERKDDPAFVLDVVALMVLNGSGWTDASSRVARILTDAR